MLALGVQQAQAFESFVVEDIQVTGLQRVELGTFFTYLPLRVGEQLDDVRAPQVIRALYRVGAFESVELKRAGNKLVIEVLERPTIATISFDGNKQIKTEALLEGLKPMGFDKGEVLNPAMLTQIVQELEQQYFAHGKYSVSIKHKVVRLSRNRVDVRFTIKEGDAAVIGQINFVGNEVFSDEELTNQMELTTGSWLSFFTDDNQYAKEKLSGDLEKIRSYYLDRGYLKFQITSTQVSISPDREQVYLTINISEGKPFTLRDITIVGDLKVEEEALRSMIPVVSGDTYSAAAFTFAETNMAKLLGYYGYAFAKVVSSPELDEEKQLVDVRILVDPGKRTYVRNISFEGNETTNDHVLRREMRMMESGPLSSDVVDRSKTLLERLTFIEEAKVETPKVEGTDDQVDVEVKIKERNAGSFTAGLGYSDLYKLQLNAGVSHDNFQGSGNRIAFNINTSKAQQLYSFSYTDPYFTTDGVSAGGQVYYQETDPRELNLLGDKTSKLGFRFTTGVPISEVSRLTFGVGWQDSSFAVNSGLNVLQLNEFFDRIGHDFSQDSTFDYTYTTLDVGWLRNTLNRGIFADRGTYQSASVSFSVPGSDFQFFKLNYELKHYIPITEGWSVLMRAELGYGDGYGDGQENQRLPYFEHFYAGGQGTLRGFERNTIGPRSIRRISQSGITPPGDGGVTPPIFLPPEYDQLVVESRSSVGGNTRVLGGLELIFPTPFAEDNRSIRTSLFVDVGNLWDSEFDRTRYSNLIEFDKIPDYSDPWAFRASAGLAVQWLSPMGPLGFHFSRSIKSEPGDEEENFGFTIGQTF